MMDFRFDTFYQVCKDMNFTKAAKNLCITQPAVSQHMKALEEYYGVPLFLYEGKKLKLTQAGEELKRVVKVQKHDDAALKRHFLEMGENVQRIRIGVTLTIGEFLMPYYLAQFLKQYSDITFSLKIGNTGELLRELNEGELDVAFVEGYFQKEEYDYIVYSTESYVAVSSRENPLVKKKQVSWKDLFSQRLIVREMGSGSREILERILADQNHAIHDFSNLLEISNISAIKQLVKEDSGITFIYERAVREELKQGSLKKLEIKNFNAAHDFTFIWRKNSIFSAQYQAIYHKCLCQVIVGNYFLFFKMIYSI